MTAIGARGLGRVVQATVAVLGIALAPHAQAKRVFVDFGEDNLENSGNGWDPAQSFELDRTGDLSCDGSPCVAIDLGFNVNFGAGSFNSLFVNENGAVTFGSPLTQGSFTPGNLADLGAPVIAPYYADLASAAPADGVFGVNPGEMLYSRGIADPDDDGDGIYSLANAVAAFHVTWAGVAVATDLTPIFTDIVIYSRGINGDFDVRFGYGDEFTPVTPADDAAAGFALGTNQLQYPGPFASSTDYYYQFRDGEWTNGPVEPPPPIDEPPTLLLCLWGIAAVAAVRRWRPGRSVRR